MGGVRWLESSCYWFVQGFLLTWAWRTLRPRVKAWVKRVLVRR